MTTAQKTLASADVATTGSCQRKVYRDHKRGKSVDPDFVNLTSYIRRDTYLAVKKRLIGQGTDLSELLEDLLIQWLERDTGGLNTMFTDKKQKTASKSQSRRIPPSRVGKKAILTYIATEQSKAIRRMAIDEDTSIQALIGEAIALLLASRRQGKVPMSHTTARG